MLNYLINLNSVNKLNNAGKYKHFIYRIGKDTKNYFIENYKGVRYTNIQNLRDVYLLLLRNNKIYISNISELKNATKVNNLFYLTRKNWLHISDIIYTQTRVGTRKFLLFEKVDNLDSWLSKQVLINKIDILFRNPYYAIVGINNN